MAWQLRALISFRGPRFISQDQHDGSKLSFQAYAKLRPHNVYPPLCLANLLTLRYMIALQTRV